MALILKILIYFYLSAGVQSVHQITWLPCHFVDENVTLNNKSHVVTQTLHRVATLQFGETGNSPVNRGAVTFLVTGSKLDLRRYMEGVGAEQVECELRRYSTEGIHVRWPVQGAQGYNRWFKCTLKHIKGLFTITGFLRHPSDQPPPGEHDYLHWPTIADGETLTTTVAMVVKTQSPSVKAALKSQQKLHCQFAIDHKAPKFTVEWHRLLYGKMVKLFSHNSSSGRTDGIGVRLKDLADGDASYNLHSAEMSSEGKYICSVSVAPVLVDLDVNLDIEERPRVFLNVEPTLSMQEGKAQKIVCEAEGYYPLDVHVVWYKQRIVISNQTVNTPLPKMLAVFRQNGHKLNKDHTYSVSSFFYLEASLSDSGKEFTCGVFHQSLREPIKISFILNVEEPISWLFNIILSLTGITLIVFLYKTRYRRSGRRQTSQKRPFGGVSVV
ncbi:tapasin-related protein-like [Acanthochromis polyacanthus]|uniref:Tapasin-related protein-like n=1 Tax=Acanthochromis polyacanthus TaxID=80966 RepID=A0A3Q1ECT6_9TELE|nr:tapasin-related protein-like [Acanthochromis polyacanthus]